jgi:hypothetical protein
VSDVTEIPDQRAHQRIMLSVKVFVGQTFQQKQCSCPGLLEEAGELCPQRRSLYDWC